MCWLSVPGSAGSNWDSGARARLLASSAALNTKHMPPRSWLRAWKTKAWIRALFGRICEPSTAGLGVASWISWLAATRASRFRWQASGRARTTRAICGPTLPGCWLKPEPRSPFSRTCPATFGLGSPESLATLPRWGSMRSGCVVERPAYRTEGNGYSYLPTLDASAHKYRLRGDSQQSRCLEAMARRGELPGHPSGPLHPAWCETFMGFPQGWTACER